MGTQARAGRWDNRPARAWTREPVVPVAVAVLVGREVRVFPRHAEAFLILNQLESCSQRRIFLGLWVERAVGSSRNSLFEIKQKKPGCF